MAEAALIISALSAVASIASAIIAYRVLARQKAADMPGVEATLSGNHSTCRLVVTMTNRALCEWGAERAEVRRPIGAKIISEFDLTRIEDGYGNSAPDLSDAVAKQQRTTPMYLRVAPVGHRANGLINGSGDRHSETLIVSLPRWTLSRTLSIRLTVASSEADQRKTTIDIVRELPAATKAAKA